MVKKPLNLLRDTQGRKEALLEGPTIPACATAGRYRPKPENAALTETHCFLQPLNPRKPPLAAGKGHVKEPLRNVRVTVGSRPGVPVPSRRRPRPFWRGGPPRRGLGARPPVRPEASGQGVRRSCRRLVSFAMPTSSARAGAGSIGDEPHDDPPAVRKVRLGERKGLVNGGPGMAALVKIFSCA